MFRILKALIIYFALVPSTEAESPASPSPYVVASTYGPYYIKTIPRGSDGGYGVAYRLNHDGSSTELWRVSGYLFEVFLSFDGMHLVKMRPWASGPGPSDDDLAVEFYKSGKLIESYSTRDLVSDASMVQRTVSHYFWRAEDERFPFLSPYNRFYLMTIDEIVYVFDVTTGEIIEKGTL